MQSFAFLVQHHLDFTLAREHHLILDDVDQLKWSKFIAHFRCIEDDQVAMRYYYGQLRLSQLNQAVCIFRPWTITLAQFYKVSHWSMSMYLKRAIAPLIFVFASLSLVLSSMQVILLVLANGLLFGHLDGSRLQVAFWVFSTIILLLSSAVWVLLLIIPFSVIVQQLLQSFRNWGKQGVAVGA